jgi:hypothetical protein
MRDARIDAAACLDRTPGRHQVVGHLTEACLAFRLNEMPRGIALDAPLQISMPTVDS